MVKFLDFSDGSLLGVNERGKTQSNAVLRSGFFAFTNPLEPERSKTKQDARQDNPAPNFIYHSWSEYLTAVLTAFFLSPALFQKLNHG